MTSLAATVTCLWLILSGPIGQRPVIHGIVTDAETHQPVKRFRVMLGSNEHKPSHYHNDAKEFEEGTYFYTPTFGTSRPIVRIEADGYLPATSDFIDLSKDVEFSVELKRAPNLEKVVLKPDGAPAAGAEVFLVTSASQLTMKNEQPDGNWFCARVRTDDNGRFVHWPTDMEFRLLVMHDSGYLELTSEDYAHLDPLLLQPWARVQGTLRIGPKPADGEQVNIQWSAPHDWLKPSIWRSYEVKADGEGRFTIDRVPAAASGRIGRYICIRKTERGQTWTMTNTRSIQTKPGETLTVAIGGAGRPVRGRFVVPKDIPKQDRSFEFSRLHNDARHYAFPVGDDGSFTIDDVEAGTYELSARIVAHDELGHALGATLASYKKRIEVPEMSGGRSDEPLDIGDIEPP